MSLKEKVKLTHYSKGGGWACKIGPGDLAQVLSKINKHKNDNIIVDFEQSDDAAVIDIGNDKYLVQTVDFFSPIVDDPFTFGQIAAANSLSDIYAMGAKPLFALNIVGFPTKELSNDILAEILKGGASLASKAGIPIVGGHSVDDSEIKYGLYNGIYYFKNVPQEHPMAILSDNQNITYSGDSSKKLTKDVNGTPYDFYYGDISLTVTGDFGNASLYCYYHGYMGGNDLLEYISQ